MYKHQGSCIFVVKVRSLLKRHTHSCVVEIVVWLTLQVVEVANPLKRVYSCSAHYGPPLNALDALSVLYKIWVLILFYGKTAIAKTRLCKPKFKTIVPVRQLRMGSSRVT